MNSLKNTQNRICINFHKTNKINKNWKSLTIHVSQYIVCVSEVNKTHDKCSSTNPSAWKTNIQLLWFGCHQFYLKLLFVDQSRTEFKLTDKHICILVVQNVKNLYLVEFYKLHNVQFQLVKMSYECACLT